MYPPATWRIPGRRSSEDVGSRGWSHRGPSFRVDGLMHDAHPVAGGRSGLVLSCSEETGSRVPAVRAGGYTRFALPERRILDRCLEPAPWRPIEICSASCSASSPITGAGSRRLSLSQTWMPRRSWRTWTTSSWMPQFHLHPERASGGTSPFLKYASSRDPTCLLAVQRVLGYPDQAVPAPAPGIQRSHPPLPETSGWRGRTLHNRGLGIRRDLLAV